MIPPLGQDLLDAVFVADIALAEKLDLDSVVGRQPLGILAKLVAERLGEFRIVEDPNLALVQIRGHPSGIADLWQGAEQQDAVPTTQYSGDLVAVISRQ